MNPLTAEDRRNPATRYRVRIWDLFGNSVLDPQIYRHRKPVPGYSIGACTAARHTLLEGWTSLRGGFAVAKVEVQKHISGRP